MQTQTASEHTIRVGRAVIQGCVTMGGTKCWALPGGEVTLSRERAEWAARWVSRRL